MHRALSMNQEEFSAWNEQMAHRYDPEQYHESGSRVVRWVERLRVRCILRLLDAWQESRVLEAGVGAGNILARVLSKRRTGLDLSPFLLQKAASRLGPDVALVRGDAEQLTRHFPPRSFDRVYCSEVLEHVQHPDAVLREMAAVVTGDGIVVVSVPNEGFINTVKGFLKAVGIFRLLLPVGPRHMEDEWHLHVFGREFLLSLARRHFMVECVCAVPSRFFPLRLVARLKPRRTTLDVLLKAPPSRRTAAGTPLFLDDAASDAVPELAHHSNAFKNFFKRWPKFYNFLFAVIGPSLLTGLTSARFVRRFPASAAVLHAGSGSRRISPTAINVDMFEFPGVDVVADLAALPFRDGVFDAVSCEQVLEHVSHPGRVTAELLRVTRSGGLIHLASPFVFPWHASPSDYHRWTLEGLATLFPGCALVEKGVTAGPCSALTALLATTLATLLSFGSVMLFSFFEHVFYVLLIPLKLLDLLAARLPGAELCAANLYIVLRKP